MFSSTFWLPLAGITIVGLLLRLWGIDTLGITHPEIYVPGIRLVDGISEPPPRLDFPFALWWHFHLEPHPLGWYLAMFGWSELFGTSHLAMRLPSAIFGAASIAAVGVLGRQIWGPWTGLLGAALLSLHGFHIFWSQAARMYTAGLFFAVLSTWFLLMLLERDRKSPFLEFGYIAACFAGIQSVELFWPILLMQAAWLLLVLPLPSSPSGGLQLWRRHDDSPRLFQIQSIALMLSFPSLAHSVYRARHNAASDPSVGYLPEYVSFGFLFSYDEAAYPPLSIPLIASVPLALFAIALVIAGLRSPARPVSAKGGGSEPVPRWLTIGALLASLAVMTLVGLVADNRNAVLLGMCILPLVTFFVPNLAAVPGRLLDWLSPTLSEAREKVSPGVLLLFLCAILAPLLLFCISFYMTILAPRAWTVFVPFLLLLIAAGAVRMAQTSKAMKVIVLGALLVIVGLSIPYSWKKPGSPRDYQGLARAMESEMLPEDFIRVGYRSWIDTPLFYYLPHANYVTKDWEEVLARNPGARLWVIKWPHSNRPDLEAPSVVPGFERTLEIKKRRAVAELFERVPAP